MYRDCRAIFLIVSISNNVPGLRVGQGTAASVIRVLKQLRSEDSNQQIPKLVLLSVEAYVAFSALCQAFHVFKPAAPPPLSNLVAKVAISHSTGYEPRR